MVRLLESIPAAAVVPAERWSSNRGQMGWMIVVGYGYMVRLRRLWDGVKARLGLGLLNRDRVKSHWSWSDGGVVQHQEQEWTRHAQRV